MIKNQKGGYMHIKSKRIIIGIILLFAAICSIRFCVGKIREYRYEINKNTDPAYLLEFDEFRIFDFRTGETVRKDYAFETTEEKNIRLLERNYGIEFFNKSKEVVYIVKGITCPYANLRVSQYKELDNCRIALSTSDIFFVVTTNDVMNENKQIYYNYRDDKFPISPLLGFWNWQYDNMLLWVDNDQIEVALDKINDSTIALYDLYDTRTFYREFPFDGTIYNLETYELIDNQRLVITYMLQADEGYSISGTKAAMVFDIEADCMQETKDMISPRTEYELNTKNNADVTKEDFNELMPNDMTLQELVSLYGSKLHLLKENTIDEMIFINEWGPTRIETNTYKEYAMSGEDFVMFLIFKNDMLNTCEYVLRSNFD